MRSENDPHISRARQVARVLDNTFVDPILGLLVPALGDLVGGAFGLYVIALAARKGLPRIVIARMFLNLSIDALVGSIPFVGDIFDFVFKANVKNVDLLEARYETARSSPADWLVVIGAALFFVASLCVPIVVGVWLWRKIRS